GMADSLRKATKVNNTLQKSNAAATRLFELQEIPVERRRNVTGALVAVNNGKAIKLPPLQREIRFEDITFTYPGANQPALQEVSLTVKKGMSVALVGRNGSGKTTMLGLLPRFFEPDSGRILIDGHDIQQVTLRSLRRQIGIVTQDSVIFPGTIEQNIAYGEARPDRDRAIAAAKEAFAHDFILEKPDGY